MNDRVRALALVSLLGVLGGCENNKSAFGGRSQLVTRKGADGKPTGEGLPGGGSPVASVAPTPVDPRPDPCAGKAPPPSAGMASKKVLFYAPSNYHYGTNQYASSVREGLALSGFEVTMVSSVNEGVQFDECNLTRSYKQIWLFLPCNNRQGMDAASFQALKKYYEYGSGLVMFTDMHFSEDNNPNSHCTATNWRGSGGTEGDAIRVGRDILRIMVDIAVEPRFQATQPANHVLVSSLAPLASLGKWPLSLSATGSSPDLRVIATQAKGASIGIIDKTDAPNLLERRLGAAFATQYCYHCTAGEVEKTAYRTLAEFVEQKVAASDAKAISLSGESAKVHLPLLEAPPEIPLATLQAKLASTEKHDIGEALLNLSARGAITREAILPFLEHETFFVRANALSALTQLPDQEGTRREVLRLLPISGRNFRLQQNLIRATALLRMDDAVPLLQEMLGSDLDVRLKGEAVVALATLRGDKAVGDLVPLLGQRNSSLQTVVVLTLEKLGISRVSGLVLDTLDKLNHAPLEE